MRTLWQSRLGQSNLGLPDYLRPFSEPTAIIGEQPGISEADVSNPHSVSVGVEVELSDESGAFLFGHAESDVSAGKLFNDFTGAANDQDAAVGRAEYFSASDITLSEEFAEVGDASAFHFSEASATTRVVMTAEPVGGILVETAVSLTEATAASGLLSATTSSFHFASLTYPSNLSSDQLPSPTVSAMAYYDIQGAASGANELALNVALGSSGADSNANAANFRESFYDTNSAQFLPEDYQSNGTKWGSSVFGTSGGTVSWSIAGPGWLNTSPDSTWFFGSTVNWSSLSLSFNYTTVLTQAFSAWSSLANISFVQVADGGGNLGSGFSADIRIGGGSIDGVSNTLASAWNPGNSAISGDIIFDSSEIQTWSSSQFLAVATHEIGHALGLAHTTIGGSLMNPYYNPSITTPQSDDIAGIRYIYGTGAPAGAGSVSINDASISEGDSGTKTMVFTVTRTGGTAAFSVNYATANSSATAGSDYAATSGTLSFGVGVNSMTVAVTIYGDTALESNETFLLNLSGATGGATISDAQGVGTIANDDVPPADLTASLNMGSVTVAAGDVLSMEGYIKNIGLGAAAASMASYYLSTDSTVTASDMLLTNKTTVALSGYGDGTNWYAQHNLSVALSSDLAPGVYYLGSIADTGSAIGESNESNNASNVVQITVTAPAPKPDLIATLTLGSTSVTVGGAIAIDQYTKNIGAGTAGASTTRFYLSADANVTIFDTLLTSKAAAALSAYGNGENWYDHQNFSVTLTGIAAGTYYLGAIADRDGVIGESNEGNNVSNVVQITVAPPKPDLVTSLNMSNKSVIVGGSLTIDEYTKNLGGATAGSSSTSYYLSTDSTVTKSDTLLASKGVGSLTAYGSGSSWYEQHSFSVALTGIAAGTYYLGAIADSDGTSGAISESNESNNVSNVVQITVTTPPDLVASLNMSNKSVTVGGSLAIAEFTKNLGGAAAGTSTTSYYLSTDSNVTTSDTFLTSKAVAALSGYGSGSSWYEQHSFSVALTGISAGTYYLGAIADTGGAIGESNEGNNTSNVVQITVTPPKPDLVASLNMSTSAVAFGGTITIDEYTKNFGAGTAGASTTRFYLSTDANVTTADTLLTSKAAAALSAYGSSGTSWYDHQTFSVALTGIASGTYYLGAIADAAGAVTEENESDNVSNVVQVTVAPPLPDLIASLTMSSTSVVVGGTITIDEYTKNFTAGTAGASTTSYYLSTDTTVTTADTLLTSKAAAALSAYGSGSSWYDHQNFSVALTGIAAGTYYLGAIADAGGAVAEGNESNNVGNVVQITVTPPKPDLIASLNMGSTSVVAGGTLAIDQYTKNFGAGTAGASTTRFYLSTDANVTTADTLLTSKAAAALSAYGSGSSWYDHQNFSVALTGIAAGTYYLGAITDAGGAVTESNESNNVGNVVQITVTPPPDLVTSLSMGNMTVVLGGSLAIDEFTKNLGNGTAAASTTSYYLSTDSTVTTADILLTSKATAALTAYGSGSSWYDHQTFSVALTGIAAGTYYLGATADAGGTVIEGNEGNNVGNTVQITVVPPPDLTGTLNMASTTVAAGSMLTIDEYTKNFGNGAAAASTTSYYLSTDSTVTTADILLTSKATAALTAYGSGSTWYDHQAFSTAISVGLAPGTYYLGALADANGQIGETDESNNVGNVVQITVTGPADLVGTLSMAATTVAAGGTLAIDQYTKNFGNGATAASSTAFYLSTDSTINTSDMLLTSKATAALAGYGSGSGSAWYDHQAFSVGLSTGLAAGTYYLGTIADAGGAVTEGNESNNVGNVVQITVTAPADLVGTLSMANITVAAGGMLAIEEYTKNFGNGATASSVTGFYLSTDGAINTSDILLATKTTAALAGYGNGSGTGWYDHQAFSTALSTGLAAGTYYLGALADANGQIGESNEGNNVGNGVQITVTTPADLVGTLSMSNMAVAPGTTIAIDEYTKNFGNGATAASTTAFYLSTDTTIDTSDIFLTSKTTAALTGYGSGTSWYDHEDFSLTLSSGLADGTYYLGAIADAGGQIGELSETNNVWNIVQIVVDHSII